MKKEVSLFLFGIFLISLVSATITISQPLTTYNYGDEIYLTATINPSVVSGNFEINVVCENASANVYRISPAESAFTANQEQKINHKIILKREYVGNISGKCSVVVSLGSETVTSNSFLLTDQINLNVKTDKYSYDPEEAITLDVSAIKVNGIPLNGFVEISGAQNIKKEIVEGQLSHIFTTESSTEAGKYDLTVHAYDVSGNEILNQKTVYVSYEIKQIARSIVISMPAPEINPGDSFEFGVDLYDQSGKEMESNLSALIVSPLEKSSQFGVSTQETGKFETSVNSTPGKYRVVVSLGTLSEEKEFYVKAVPKLDISFLDNSSLVVLRNIGNAEFNDTINITIGDNIAEELSLSILPGEERRFNLKAPNGEYNVNVASGDVSAQKNLLLTGRAIEIKEYNGLDFISSNTFIWTVLGILILIVAAVLLGRFKKTTNYKDKIVPEKKENLNVVSAKMFMKKQQKEFLELGKSNVAEAESSLNMNGKKDFASVVSLAVKNNSTLGMEARKKINELVSVASDKGGVVDWKGNHALLIFSPLLTKTYKNEIIASKVAWKIKTELDEYNSMFKDKISYNIGINCGELVSSVNNGKLNYTSLGNTVLAAKRISESSLGKVLVSVAFRQKLMRELKVNKIDDNTFEVTRIADVDANNDKLKDLLKRTGF